MDRLISDLTVADFIGVQAIILLLFFFCVQLTRFDMRELPIYWCAVIWIGGAIMGGLPVYFGLKVFGFFPG